jgi:NSS family neurotransmitter:Na+ symporter
MAAVGSAVGLGNMWRFSYLAAENGGAAFLLLYVGMAALVGLPVLLAELTVGRGAGKSPILALEHFGGPAWRPLGVLFVVSGLIIAAYYPLIAGWTVRYALDAALFGFAPDAAARFGAISTGPVAIVWQVLFLVASLLVVAGGVHGGIERVAMVLMPVLFAILVGLACYAATLDGAARGYGYYLDVDFGALASPTVWRDAAGQAFFSLSVGMGAMLTFASYLSRQHNLPNESIVIAGSDFLVAFVAGLVVFPLIFALGLQEDVGGSTMGALFITLPSAFAEMGTAGRIVGLAFFLALVVGALTSAVSVIEVMVSVAIDQLGWSRRSACLAVGALTIGIGIPPALNLEIFAALDQLAGNVFLIAGGLALSLFVGWRMPNALEEVRAGAEGVRWFFLWRGLLRYVVPAVLGVVLFFSLRDTGPVLAALFDS